jgi:hypothetical protein
MTEGSKLNAPLPRPPGMSKKQLSPLQRVLADHPEKMTGADSRNNQKENTLTMPLIHQ